MQYTKNIGRAWGEKQKPFVGERLLQNLNFCTKQNYKRKILNNPLCVQCFYQMVLC